MKNLPLIGLLLTLVLPARAADPFIFDSAPGWRPERISFPLGFAPELKYRGFEELRFGPGMFRPGTDSYWSYVFFWWIEGRATVSKEQLERDLLHYYRGLSRAVGRSKGLKIHPEKITASLQPAIQNKDGKPPHGVDWSGTLTTYDAFATGRLLRLHVEVSHHYFAGADRTWVWFSVSPKNPSDAGSRPLWEQMRKMKRSFKLR